MQKSLFEIDARPRENFYFDRGLFLLPGHIGLDVRRRQQFGFISHAHMDHSARHQTVLCTPETAALVRHRIGETTYREMPLGQPFEFRGTRLTPLSAGHVLGSAMLLAETDEGSVLYTGDYRLGQSYTAGQADLPHSDILVMECTFGDPFYRLPPRSETIAQFVELVEKSLRRGATPMIHAYVLGKAQEVTKILTEHGIRVQQPQAVYDISQIYTECGCDLGHFELYDGRPKPGHAIVTAPRSQRGCDVRGVVHAERFAMTGWGWNPRLAARYRCDHVIPLSDHADYGELLETIEQVAPQRIYCTHGPKKFVDDLLRRGHQAYWLG
ncbi:MBL fold metallo-hydrolase RNA specificity domain-containing protein [Blastopirellula retiformator]|uniref:Ribonuclease n=1 Tax=Blastopirellula retiformator TaxID=2527970 RepID=A0A5C5VM52_9BACT|nr:MBL fold metallo-hydrolase RNA specificity domain-containing protein [Blastopirellula retiformator]TWT38955.1 Ribonuclease [Blastopirellula retiformator]